MWLKELLPASLPNVRIMTFGYNAAFRNFTAHQDLRHIATKLLSELVDLRTGEDVSSALMKRLKMLVNNAANEALLFRKSIGGLSSFAIA